MKHRYFSLMIGLEVAPITNIFVAKDSFEGVLSSKNSDTNSRSTERRRGPRWRKRLRRNFIDMVLFLLTWI